MNSSTKHFEAPMQPLQCAHCGALVPLGHGATARCSYCGSDTPVPAQYGALQQTSQSFAADRRLAQELYGRVGRPPGWVMRWLDKGTESTSRIGGAVGRILLLLLLAQPLIGVGLVMAGAYLLGFPVATIIHTVESARGIPRLPLSPYVVLPSACLGSMVFLGIPMIVVQRERRLAKIRRDIHASLAAALPERPGGPSLCRLCGAPLDVPRGALGVPCTYCGADNLVALPEDWVKRVQASEFEHFLQIDAALNAFRQASRATQEQMWKLGFILVLAAPLIMALAWLLVQAGIEY